MIAFVYFLSVAFVFAMVSLTIGGMLLWAGERLRRGGRR